MTEDQRALLTRSIDGVVRLELSNGESFPAQILFVFEEGDTPDVFFLKVARNDDGIFVQQGESGRSELLSDIAGVYPLEV